MRKKAKYLHDAPNEALLPGIVGGLYSHASATMRSNGQGSSGKVPQLAQTTFYPPAHPTYNMYAQNKPMPPPMMQDNINSGSFNAQSPVSPSFSMAASQGIVNPNLPSSAVPTGQNGMPSTWGGALFDPSDPALFNFDLASMNFGNHYGALEFGMLGHMATGAGETPPSDNAAHRGSTGHSSAQFTPVTGGSSFSESPSGQNPYMFSDSIMSDWPNGQNSSIYGQTNQSILHRQGHDVPHAFAIETGPGNFSSPNSNSSPGGVLHQFDESPTMTSTGFKPSLQNSNSSSTSIRSRQPHPKISTPNLKPATLPTNKKRHRDPSTIYSSVSEPYSYTTGFHSLTAFLQRRFSPAKTLRIAKALASIRPSFIATTKTLNRDDLIFMEKCFQRTLWEYEDFINACGTPTIVCRRTGEVAAVGKEFSILTGWKKDVLLGKEPNLNVNTGGTSDLGTGTSSRGGFNTPRQTSGDAVQGRPQPVFLAELLDDESVIEFYEDFARLAFGDSRGSVTTRCKLLKYKTKDDPTMIKGEGDSGIDDKMQHSQQLRRNQSVNLKVKQGIAGEAGMERLGFRDGKVDCTYCWTVKRDVFDIPMLIVMNVYSAPNTLNI